MGGWGACFILALSVQKDSKQSLCVCVCVCVCVCDKKENLLNVLLTSTFIPWLLNSWIYLGTVQNRRKDTHTKAGCKFHYQETWCVLIYGKILYIFSYKDVLHATIFSPFMIWEKINRFCCISEFFIDPTRNVNYEGKQNSEKIQRVKIRPIWGKRHKSDY